jgi:hypothetical protein
MLTCEDMNSVDCMPQLKALPAVQFAGRLEPVKLESSASVE